MFPSTKNLGLCPQCREEHAGALGSRFSTNTASWLLKNMGLTLEAVHFPVGGTYTQLPVLRKLYNNEERNEGRHK